MKDNFYRGIFKSIFYLLILFSFLGCDKKFDKEYFARVNGEIISVDDFSKRLEYFTRMTGMKDNLQTRENLLDQMINETLLIQEFNKKNLNDLPQFKRKVSSIRHQFYLDELRKRAFFDTISVSEREIKSLFDFYNQKVSARHLYARSKDEAEKLYQQLKEGASFDELAKFVFQDSTLAANGGYLGYFGKDEMDPGFEKVAFSLEVGEISKPVKTQYGYSIIQVEDRIRIPITNESAYIKKRPILIKEIRRKKSFQRAQRYGNQLAGNLNLQFNENLVKFIYSKFISSNAESNIMLEGNATLEDDLTETIRNEKIVDFEGGAWSVQDFMNRATSTSKRQQKRIKTEADFKKFITGLIIREELIKQSQKSGIDKDQHIKKEINHAIDGYKVNRMVELITDSATVPEVAAKQIYEKNTNDYIYPAEANIREILVPNMKQAKKIMKRIEAGESFAELAQTYSIREWAKQKGGELGYAPKYKYGNLADTVFSMNVGDIVGPLEIDGYYSIIKLIGKREPRQKSFEEARPQIEREQLWKWRKIRLHNHVGELRREADIKVLQDKLRWHVFDFN